MSLHKEIHFEVEICASLAARGWLYAEGDAAGYDRVRALFPADLLAWVQATQPKAWDLLVKNHGANAGETLLGRVRADLDKRGTLDVLRRGIDVMGLRESLKLAEFKPALGLNAEILSRYQANRLRVVRQVRYSVHHENSIDLVLFLNGLPVATAELKSDFTQSVGDAVDQYKFDRLPRTKSQAVEPLLHTATGAFPGGALVHFAVSHNEVKTTTRLDGPATTFLPFNRGNDQGAGNPVNENGGPRTAYLWEEVWARESWLEILGRYLVPKRDEKKVPETIIFPRYHQLDVTRRLEAQILADGPGRRYLIQHSAGSGKTKSIAWTAHFLADLHDASEKKVFDTVLVISDRTVIDGQLRDELLEFQRTPGVVEVIAGEGASKSGELATALSQGKKIIVCTIQTFPFALAEVRRLAAAEGKRFAVIADEAHSSQAGEAAARLKAVLSAEELAELDDGGEVSTEDLLAAQMAARSDDAGITFVAFTATPKNKTLELFGTRPDPSRKPAPDNVPAPFHVYSMRQAIEEGFILDVLRNYTPYSLAFKLSQAGSAKEIDEREVERSAALKKLMGWVKLHPYNIAQKVQIVIEHYRENVQPLLGGRAKAMVVVASRKEAVRWQLAMQRYIADKGYKLGTLVAFSGEVIDPESGPESFTEHSVALNPKLAKKDIKKAFEGGEYQVLLVANKFQTGFDQPLLCGMYVDKRLAGIQAVQTLSRLNRATPGKDTTFVVDFVNDPNDVLEAFRTYYKTAELSGTTDPNLVFDLRAKLDASGHYDEPEVDRVVRAELDPRSKQSDLIAALEPVVDRLIRAYRTAQESRKAALDRGDEAAAARAKDTLDALLLFRSDLGAYVRLYTFLSQIYDYGNTSIEKRAIFFKRLEPLLEFGREREQIDLSQVKLTHHVLRNRGQGSLGLAGGQAPKLDPLTEAGSGGIQEKQTARLREIIEKVNTLFDGELTDNDKLVYVNNVLLGKLLESHVLVQQAASNTKAQFATSPDLRSELMNAIIASLDAHMTMGTQALNSESVRAGLEDILLNHAGLWEALRATSRSERPQPRETDAKSDNALDVSSEVSSTGKPSYMTSGFAALLVSTTEAVRLRNALVAAEAEILVTEPATDTSTALTTSALSSDSIAKAFSDAGLDNTNVTAIGVACGTRGAASLAADVVMTHVLSLPPPGRWVGIWSEVGDAIMIRPGPGAHRELEAALAKTCEPEDRIAAFLGPQGAPLLLPSVEPGEPVKIHFATNRTRASHAYYDARVGPLRYGRAVVTDSPNRSIGTTARMTLNEVTEADRFPEVLRGELSAGGRDVLVFVHGYRVTFEKAVIRTAQLKRDLQYTGPALCFSWPSYGRFIAYTGDEVNVENSYNAFAACLEALADAGAQHIHIIAHSMGNRLLINVLDRIGQNTTPIGARLAQLVFAAPDVDQIRFRQVLSGLSNTRFATRATLYASRTDRALQLSRLFHFGQPRAGDVTPPNVVILQGVDTLDMTNANTDSLGHSVYSDQRAVLGDLNALIRHNAEPPRFGLQEDSVDAVGRYWRFR